MLTTGRALGLVLLGFMMGIVFSGFNRGSDLHEAGFDLTKESLERNALPAGEQRQYTRLAATDAWHVVTPKVGIGRHIALVQDGRIRVRVVDDYSALFVTTYKDNDRIWEGRLMDVGNDGSVEVADITNGHCEQF